MANFFRISEYHGRFLLSGHNVDGLLGHVSLNLSGEVFWIQELS